MNITLITGAGCSYSDNNKEFFTDDLKNKLSKKYFFKNPKEVTDLLFSYRETLSKHTYNKEFYTKISQLQETYNINIITQNVDNCHAINSNVVELHGNIFKDRTIWNWFKRYTIPDVVLYGEPIRGLYRVMKIISESDINIFIGTSMKTQTIKEFINYSNGKNIIVNPNDIDIIGAQHIKMTALEGLNYCVDNKIII